jgi:hypothetical protein
MCMRIGVPEVYVHRCPWSKSNLNPMMWVDPMHTQMHTQVYIHCVFSTQSWQYNSYCDVANVVHDSVWDKCILSVITWAIVGFQLPRRCQHWHEMYWCHRWCYTTDNSVLLGEMWEQSFWKHENKTVVNTIGAYWVQSVCEFSLKKRRYEKCELCEANQSHE